MSDETNDEASELAQRAAQQAKNAAKNSGRAAKAAAEPVIEHVVEEARDTAEKLEGTAKDIADTIDHVNAFALRKVTKEAGLGVFALVVSAYAGKLALNKFIYAVGYAKGTKSALDDFRQVNE